MCGFSPAIPRIVINIFFIFVISTSNPRYMKILLYSAACLFLFSLLIFSSCKKEGTGGEATIVAFPKHHEKTIKGATVYVKFGTKEFSGKNASDYDLTVTGEPEEDHVHIEELKWGDYYLYASGYDSSIARVVTGGVPITIKRSEKKEEIVVQIPVSED